MVDLKTEVQRFQEWANLEVPIECRVGEWECAYEHWNGLFAAVFKFLDRQPVGTWSTEETNCLMYALARDNEVEQLAYELRTHYPDALFFLAKTAIESGEPDCKWQIAEQLGWLGERMPEAESILVQFAKDRDEYVRRRSLGSLARLGSGVVEALALEEWKRPDPHQLWSRMMVLTVLRRINSPQLESYLKDSERNGGPDLADYARRIRRGDSDIN